VIGLLQKCPVWLRQTGRYPSNPPVADSQDESRCCAIHNFKGKERKATAKEPAGRRRY